MATPTLWARIKRDCPDPVAAQHEAAKLLFTANALSKGDRRGWQDVTDHEWQRWLRRAENVLALA